MYRTEPPTDKTIREWYMKFQQSGCLCAAKRRDRPGPWAPAGLVQKETLRDSLPIDMLLSAVSFLVVAQSSSEVPEGLMNNSVFGTLSASVIFSIEPTSESGGL